MRKNNMKMKLCVLLGVFLSSMSLLKAQVILQVDMASNELQAGFQQMNSTPATFGAYTVTLSGGDGFFPWVGGNGSGPYADLYQGYYYSNSGAILGMNISGLTAGSTYSLQLFSFDSGHMTTIMNWAPSGSTFGTSGSSGPASGAPVNDEYSVTLTLLADGGGNITVVGADSIDNFPRLNGFILSAVSVPEPSTVASMGLGLAFLALRLRRRLVS
jgi:hypothetical protein